MNGSKDQYFVMLARKVPHWQDIIAKIEAEIEEPLKKNALDAVAIFRRVLGNRFFRKEGEAHVLQRKWSNIVPWQLTELCEWADVIDQMIKVKENGDYLCELLRNREKCKEEGIYFLNIASELLRGGLNVDFIRGSQEQKLPDIRVTDVSSKESFYIEVTRLEKNAAFKRDEMNFRIIGDACRRAGFFLLTSVQILHPLNDDDLKNAVMLIESTARKASELGRLQVTRELYIDIAFAPENEINEFNDWLAASGRRKGINGVEVQADETRRIAMYRIANKVKQFPPGETGVIYMPVEFLYFMVMDQRRVLVELKEAMKCHPFLKGIVLTCDVIDPVNNYCNEFDGEDVYSVRSAEGHTSHYLYCINDNFKGKLGLQALKIFRQSFIS